MPSARPSSRCAAGALVLLLAVAASPVAQAQTAITEAFPVNAAAPLRERDTALARAPDGRTVIVWEDAGTVRGRRYEAAGQPLDDGFVIDSAGHDADVAIAADGGFIVSWVQAGTPDRAVFRRYGADAVPLGPVTRVPSEAPELAAVQTAIALGDDGRFAIATTRTGARRGVATGPLLLFPVGAAIVDVTAAPLQVGVAHVDADGSPLGHATLSRSTDLTLYLAVQSLAGAAVEGATPRLAGNVDVALDADGDAVVVWDTVSAVGLTPLAVVAGGTLGRVAGSVQLRRLRRGATQPGPAVTVDSGQSLVIESFSPGELAFAPPSPRPAIARRPDGRLAVAYALPMSFAAGAPSALDAARGLDRSLRLKTLSPALLPTLRPTVVASGVEAVALAVDPAGAAVVAWEGAQPGPISVQRFDAGLQPLAAAVAVGSRDRQPFSATTAPIGLGVAADGSFAVSWQQRQPQPFTTAEEVRARVYRLP